MPVQVATIPAMRARQDLIVQARTGSGKTGAFGIPIVAEVDPELRAPQAIVLTPTRELANQVANEIITIGKHRNIVCLPIYGGVGYGAQLEGLEAGPHVVVGTPGRILDHLGQGRLKLDQIRFFVLDEADELLSLGFWPDMREIDRYLPRKEDRQTCLFSATMPEKVRSLTRVFQQDPEFVTLSEGQIAPAEIEHYFYLVSAQEKEQALVRILEYEDPESAIIFCNTKDNVRYVTTFLQRRGFDADQISGDLAQAARERAMARIKAGELRFLVATDVAARGIDIPELSHVILYEQPEDPESYIHRSGRTGRAGATGQAISLVAGSEQSTLLQIDRRYKIGLIEQAMPTDEDVQGVVSERVTALLEARLRKRDSLQTERMRRFIPLARTLGQTDEEASIVAMLLDDYYQEVLHAAPPVPEEAPRPAPAAQQHHKPKGSGRRRKR